jgi:hypothetical protein
MTVPAMLAGPPMTPQATPAGAAVPMIQSAMCAGLMMPRDMSGVPMTPQV